MGSPASELSLDCMTSGSFAAMAKSLADQSDQSQNKLEEFVARLEEERLKIEAFKRELPLCMQLLNSAMETYNEQLQQLEKQQTSRSCARPMFEEFIPLKSKGSAADVADNKAAGTTSEKLSWMVSAQLWNPASCDSPEPHQLSINSLSREAEQSCINGSPTLELDSKQRSGGAFLPFSKEKGKTLAALPELALGSSEKEANGKLDNTAEEIKNNALGQAMKRENGTGNGATSYGVREKAAGKVAGSSSDGKPGINNQTHRKARRCWSPDLHRRFINALQLLGGSQVATPKQIRELMKVDGLTNDEVKSHLQKYRLHTRRPIQVTQPPPLRPPPQLVVLGGIWVPPEYATSAAAAAATGIYGVRPAAPPTHLTSSTMAPVPLDFHPVALPLRQQPAHHAAAYKARHVSPESDMNCGGGERSESIDEGEKREEDDDDDCVDEEKHAIDN